MTSYECVIAKIKSTFLGIEDHGIFTFAIHLDYGGSGQGYGHICLGSAAHPDADGLTFRFINRILEACGVDNWEKLPGRTVYAIKEAGWGGMVRGLAPLPTEKGVGFYCIDGEFFTYFPSEASKAVKA